MKEDSRVGREKQYLDDLKTIKELLIDVEEKPLVESWAFFTWGFCVVIGSVIHYFTEVYLGFKTFDLIVKVWLPVVLVGGFFESIAYVKRMSKEAIPLFTRTIKKFFLTFATLLIGFGVIAGIFIELNAAFYIPILLTLFMGICFACYAYVSASWMYYQAFFLMVVGILLFVFDFHNSFTPLVVGGAIGITFIWGGISSRRQEKK